MPAEPDRRPYLASRKRGDSPARSPVHQRRSVLDREQVLAAAVAFVDEHGARHLTMRALGEQLGVEAMSIYRYVPSRESLLDGIVERVVDEVFDDPEAGMSAVPQDWQEYLQRVAHGVRRMALAHPQVFPLVATRPPQAPWLRPPLRSLRWVESFLDALLSRGFSDLAAVAVYRGFSSFLLGHLMLEVSALGVDIGPLPEPDPGAARPEANPLANFPHLRRLESELAADKAGTEFEESLENLLDRFELLRDRR